MNNDVTAPTIMVIDNDPASLRVLGSMLTQLGYTVRSFPGGPPALQSAREDPPDLILLDIRMPGMDGFEVCTQFKTADTLNGIPVLFLSALDETEEKIRAFEVGGADYITKPFQHNEVLARVRTHLTIRSYQTALEEANEELHILNKELEKPVIERTAACRECEERYRRIVTTANEGIISTDDQFRITYANTEMAELMGGSVEDIVGRPAFDFIHNSDREDHQLRLQARMDGKKESYERRIMRLDGETRWAIISASPIMDPENRFQGSVVMATDITHRKRSEIKLKKAYREVIKLKKQIEAEKIYLQKEIKIEHNFEEIIGSSDEIKYALYRVEQVAKTDSTVIILGETGTGKELIARALHNASERAARSLIKVNCAALPEQFIESELFGHEKGAYTGAVKTRRGRFELAHQGTIFLDEIGELPLALQAKLLRVLQDQEFERLGSSRTIKSDARVIAASNRDLEALVRTGKFRLDLWYRIDVFPITMPPLRQRKVDIPMLVNHFVKKICNRIGKIITKIPKTVLDELMAYDWPGNIRELEHVIERSVITAPGESLQLTERLHSVLHEILPDHPDVIKSHASMEHEHILRALEKTNWVIKGPRGAAKILKLNPNTLRYRMQKLDIRRSFREGQN
jgi:PAS domain S-box-containing protein